ncbi:glycosyltransferase family 2 protein [Dactylosporangium sp. NPDC000555]|uniref:glycosyltransferase family 2 protein n=1 Tax=Dactylosporangium sp. NPDC000555 TaxID=3154260 RepID=UPI0033320DC7
MTASEKHALGEAAVERQSGHRVGVASPTATMTVSLAPEGELADCVVVIVAYNSAKEIGGLLDSLPAAADGLRLRVIVVDNDSADNTAEVVAARPWATHVPSGGNLGYSGGINVGRRTAGPTRAIAVLNPDLRLEPGSLRRLADAAQAPGAGAAVPRMLDGTGGFFPSLRREPTVLRALGDALLGGKWPSRPGVLSEMVWSRGSYERAGEVDWATGAAIVITAEADAQVGPWDDERFFLYSEETDYCRRLRQAGFAIHYIPEATARHEGGGSGAGPALVALSTISRLRYFRKYHGRFATALFVTALGFSELLRVRRPGNRRAMLALLSRRSRATLPGMSARP